jgi:hypothetical protein
MVKMYGSRGSDLILRPGSPNGYRCARNGRGGDFEDAIGLSLAPLLARADEIRPAEFEAEWGKNYPANLRKIDASTIVALEAAITDASQGFTPNEYVNCFRAAVWFSLIEFRLVDQRRVSLVNGRSTTFTGRVI